MSKNYSDDELIDEIQRVGKIVGGKPTNYNYGESWDSIRKEVISRDGKVCRICESEGKINVHHIKPRRLFEDPESSNTMENLITLCPSCHGQFEGMWIELDHKEFESRAKNVRR